MNHKRTSSFEMICVVVEVTEKLLKSTYLQNVIQGTASGN